MNAVEIEEAISSLAEQPFDAEEFPFAFLKAFDNKETTIKRLRSGTTNKSNMDGVLQTNNIHILVCGEGEVTQTLSVLRDSPVTSKFKAKFILATDGIDLEAEELNSGETVACAWKDFPDHFGFFLPLAGITTVRQIRENTFDIRATKRLNKLYIELLKENPDWGRSDRSHAMNHFMARLIFCFFAEDTDIFQGNDLFTNTIKQMSARDSSNTHEVISELFRAMNTEASERKAAKLPRWAEAFPYVNGGLFSDSVDVPRFTRIARSHLYHIGHLEWTKINPDIFGSMIQAVADEEERGSLGMHYTSVPNILKVLNPLFLDDLREKLGGAGNNARKLLNLRNRMANIRIFDPACGSGNFLVIAYKEMREIEAEINRRRGESGRKTDIPITNFRGIELRDFPAEIARLALIIAEYQCDVVHRGQKEALAEFLPLNAMNWITCGNALRMDWLGICPPTDSGVKLQADDLFYSPSDQAEVDFENEGGETYICGNPPYLGSSLQSREQKADLEAVFSGRAKNWKSLDYVAGWFMKAADYGSKTKSIAAFVATNSICQGSQVPILWPTIFSTGHEIIFAHTSFKWQNLASDNAGVTVIIVAISNQKRITRNLYSQNSNENTVVKRMQNINAYLVNGIDIEVIKSSYPISQIEAMTKGNQPTDNGGLIFSPSQYKLINIDKNFKKSLLRRFVGSKDLINGSLRYCLWIEDSQSKEVSKIPVISERLSKIQEFRAISKKAATQAMSKQPYRFSEIRQNGDEILVVVPSHSSENRDYLPVALYERGVIVSNSSFALYDAPLWNVALLASRIHLVWIATVCGKLKTDYRYSNTLGWNTFPLPKLTEKNRTDLTSCAENILLAREVHFPATIADLYDPQKMPDNLKEAHNRNDEVLERIYIGRRFENDTERLEKLFELYAKMIDTSNESKKEKETST